MSEEELQKKMNFIVAQRARFRADMQLLRRSEDEMERKCRQLTKALTSLVSTFDQLAQAQARAARATAEAQARATDRLAAQSAKQVGVDDPLNRLINTVERYINERRKRRAQNGDSEKPSPSA